MALTAQDELTLFQNIIAQSPQGLNDPNLIGKFAKAKFDYHRMNSQAEIDRLNPPSSPVQVPQQPISPEAANVPPEGDQGSNMPITDSTGQDQTQGQPTAGKYDNL